MLFPSERLAKDICKAAMIGDEAKLAELLNSTDRTFGGRALAMAASGGHMACVKLLQERSDPLWRDRLGLTALMSACMNGRAEMAALLLQLCDPDATDSRGRGALLLAVQGDHPACVEALLGRANPLLSDAEGVTPLMAAAIRDRLECAKLLLPVSDMDAKDGLGRTARDWASERGNANVLALFDSWRDERELEKTTPQAERGRVSRGL